jgi:hypothetical protein
MIFKVNNKKLSNALYLQKCQNRELKEKLENVFTEDQLQGIRTKKIRKCYNLRALEPSGSNLGALAIIMNFLPWCIIYYFHCFYGENSYLCIKGVMKAFVARGYIRARNVSREP